MFEAHTLNAEDLGLQLVPASCWQKTWHRTHRQSLRPLKIWFAEGKRKDSQQQPHRTRFVYIEYRDNNGSNGYHCLEIMVAGQSVEQVLEQAVNVELPALQSR